VHGRSPMSVLMRQPSFFPFPPPTSLRRHYPTPYPAFFGCSTILSLTNTNRPLLISYYRPDSSHEFWKAGFPRSGVARCIGCLTATRHFCVTLPLLPLLLLSDFLESSRTPSTRAQRIIVKMSYRIGRCFSFYPIPLCPDFLRSKPPIPQTEP
jgi:hypothetical protein